MTLQILESSPFRAPFCRITKLLSMLFCFAPTFGSPSFPPLIVRTTKMATATKEVMNPPLKKYGSVVLTLENVLLPPEKLSPSPSQLDGLDSEIEMDLRILGCELIQTGGILLKLPQVCGEVLPFFPTVFLTIFIFLRTPLPWFFGKGIHLFSTTLVR